MRWARRHPKSSLAIAAVVVLFVIAGIVGQKPSPRSTSQASSGAPTGAIAASANAQAKASVNRALKDIASDYQVFHSYLITATILKNLDHSLRSVSSLRASSSSKSFSVSVRSASGTTFEVDGIRRHLDRICRPSSGCPGGHWSGGSRLAFAPVPHLTASQKAQVRSILLASVNHYAQLLSEGQQILGSTQYPNANAGLSAFADPSSAASRFSAYRKHPNPENDLSYLNAFKKADRFFTAANEPQAIGTWRDDMGQAQGDLYRWVTDAVSWQIKELSTSRLQADAATVTTDLAKARRSVEREWEQRLTDVRRGENAVSDGVEENRGPRCERDTRSHPGARVRQSPANRLTLTQRSQQLDRATGADPWWWWACGRKLDHHRHARIGLRWA
jgi:hypothetical protein